MFHQQRERERDLTHIELLRFLCRIDREKQGVSNRDGDANRQQGRAIYAWKNSERERESEMVRSEQTVQERGWFRIPSIFSLSYKPMSIFKLLLFFSRVVWNNSHVCNTGSWFDSWTSLKGTGYKRPIIFWLSAFTTAINMKISWIDSLIFDQKNKGDSLILIIW